MSGAPGPAAPALTPAQTAELRQRQMRRNRAMFWVLSAFAALFFAISLVKAIRP